jgi:hypothetical protein
MGDLQESAGERGADALALPRVGHHQTQLPAAIIGRTHVAERDDVTAIRLARECHQSNPPRIVHVREHAQQRIRQNGHWPEKAKVPRRQTQAREELPNRAVFAAPQRPDTNMAAVRQCDVVFVSSF